MGTRGKARILGPGLGTVRAPLAALANGTLAHAFELDNLTWPNTGVHPGATLLDALRDDLGLTGENPKQVEELAVAWRPYSSVAVWYLWRSLENQAAL